MGLLKNTENGLWALVQGVQSYTYNLVLMLQCNRQRISSKYGE